MHKAVVGGSGQNGLALIDARKHPDFDEQDGGRWVTFCEVHGLFVQHETRALARDWMSEPETWCEGCREMLT